jgi:hypothetical protein
VSAFHLRYVAAWCSFCLFALVLFTRHVRVPWRAHFSALVVPWRLALFVPAVLFVTFAGRYTDDETWDVVSGGGMALLTFFTAGASVGLLARFVSGRASGSEAVVALALTLFSSSWFYDGYLLLRDGAYTHRWLGNLLLSPIAYVSAGLVLNLERRGEGLGFAFTRATWPAPDGAAPSWKLAVAVTPLVAVAAWVLIGFVGWARPW